MSELSKLRLTVFPNGIASFLVDSNAEIKTENHTVINKTDSGKTLVSSFDGMIYDMASLTIGEVVTFVNMADDGQASVAISPFSGESITYAGDATIDLDLINTKATAKKGDYVTLASLGGTSWQVTSARGIWAKEV